MFRPALLRTTARRVPSAAARRQASSNAGEQAGKAAESAQKAVGAVTAKASELAGALGKRAEGLLGAYREPVTYNLSVLKELLKQVYVRERLAPPRSLSDVLSTYASIGARAANPQWWAKAWSEGALLSAGVVALEAYGIFKLGEIVGKRRLVGYAPKEDAHH